MILLIAGLFLLHPVSAGAAGYLDSLVLVPAGEFVMGDGYVNCGVDEHSVILTRDFHLGRHEVCNGEYLAALQWAYDHGHVSASSEGVYDVLDGSEVLLVDLSDACSEIQFDGDGLFFLREAPCEPAHLAYPQGYDPGDHAVKVVSWYGAVSFCDWLSMREGLPRAYDHATWLCNGGDPYAAAGFRLPTDAEWEYAAQFDDERSYPWGEAEADCDLANWSPPSEDACVGWTAPACGYPPAPAILDLCDLGGSLWEFVNDWWICNLGGVPAVDPVGPASGSVKVVHGGGFNSVDYDMRCSARGNNYPHATTYAHGFRIARSASGTAVVASAAPPGPRLLAPQPNPFNPSVRLRFVLSEPGRVVLDLYDPGGRCLAVLLEETLAAGEHSLTWHGRDATGRRLAGGVYFARLRMEGCRGDAVKLMLLR